MQLLPLLLLLLLLLPLLARETVLHSRSLYPSASYPSRFLALDNSTV